MDKEYFIDLIREDNELQLINEYKNNVDFLEGIYNLCKEANSVQRSAEVIKLENGFGYQIEESKFDKFRSLLSELAQKLDINNKDIFDVLKKYYFHLRNHESDSRIHVEHNPDYDWMGGLYGTLYDFDDIDWNYFEKMIKLSIH